MEIKKTQTQGIMEIGNLGKQTETMAARLISTIKRWKRESRSSRIL